MHRAHIKCRCFRYHYFGSDFSFRTRKLMILHKATIMKTSRVEPSFLIFGRPCHFFYLTRSNRYRIGALVRAFNSMLSCLDEHFHCQPVGVVINYALHGVIAWALVLLLLLNCYTSILCILKVEASSVQILINIILNMF